MLCVAAAVLGSSPVPLVKPPEAPWLPPPLRKAGLAAGLSVAKGGFQNARRAHPDTDDWQPHRDGIGRSPRPEERQAPKKQ